MYAHACYYLLKFLDILIIYLIIKIYTYMAMCLKHMHSYLFFLAFHNGSSHSLVITYIDFYSCHTHKSNGTMWVATRVVTSSL